MGPQYSYEDWLNSYRALNKYDDSGPSWNDDDMLAAWLAGATWASVQLFSKGGPPLPAGLQKIVTQARKVASVHQEGDKLIVEEGDDEL